MKKSNFKKINQDGVAIIWTLMFSMIFLVIVTTLVLLVVKGLRLTSTVDQSNRAYLAAEAGMERAMYEIKQQLKNDIFWCPAGAINYNRNLDGTSLLYRATVTCTSVPVKKITIESTGTDRGVVNRKLKSEINFVDPTGKIEKFDTLPADYSYQGQATNKTFYYPFSNTGVDASSPLIIQQFDISNLASLPNRRRVLIGLSQGTPGHYYSINLIKRSNDIIFIMQGSFGSSFIQSSPNFIEIEDPGNDTYRVIIEYARQGSFYTVIRATVLQRIISASGQETFECKDDDEHYVVYGFFSGLGPDPGYIRLYAQGGNIDHQVFEGNGYMRMHGTVRVDNMVLWGKE